MEDIDMNVHFLMEKTEIGHFIMEKLYGPGWNDLEHGDAIQATKRQLEYQALLDAVAVIQDWSESMDMWKAFYDDLYTMVLKEQEEQMR